MESRKKDAEHEPTIMLGDTVTDRVSGFTGIAVGTTEWLYGCRSFGVQSKELKDGLPVAIKWFDEQSLKAEAAAPGGPCESGGPSCGVGQ